METKEGLISTFTNSYALHTTCVIGVGIILVFVRRYFQGARCTSMVALTGKTVVLTGGNSGIGKATAVELARRGARVVLGCREVENSQRALQEIKQQSGSDAVYLKKLDLSAFSSICEFSKNVLDEFPAIHILVNNAAVICDKETTADGFDKQWSVNYLGHFLLTNLLLDRMKESAPSRIVNVGSVIYANKLDFDDLMQERSYQPMSAYRHTKLATCLFTTHLASLLGDSNVTVNTVCPGLAWTQLGRHIIEKVSTLKKLAYWCFFSLVAKSSWFGSQTVVYCCVASELDGVNGLIFRECKVMATKPHAQDPIDAERLWKISSEQTKLQTLLK